MQVQVHASMNPSTTSSVASLGNIGRWAVAPLHVVEILHLFRWYTRTECTKARQNAMQHQHLTLQGRSNEIKSYIYFGSGFFRHLGSCAFGAGEHRQVYEWMRFKNTGLQIIRL